GCGSEAMSDFQQYRRKQISIIGNPRGSLKCVTGTVNPRIPFPLEKLIGDILSGTVHIFAALLLAATVATPSVRPSGTRLTAAADGNAPGPYNGRTHIIPARSRD